MLHQQPAIITGRASKRLAVGQLLVGRPSRFGFGSEASGEIAVIEVGVQNSIIIAVLGRRFRPWRRFAMGGIEHGEFRMRRKRASGD